MTFERLAQLGAEMAGRRVEARKRMLGREAVEALPGGVRLAIEKEGIVLSGRGLKRRLVLDPALRALLARLR